MMTIIACTNCKNKSSLPLTITFEPKMKVCKSCQHTDVTKWEFYFCCIECMEVWLRENDVFSKGFPCEDCMQTGCFAGFESNGKCPTCKGKKVVKDSKMIGFAKPSGNRLKKS